MNENIRIAHELATDRARGKVREAAMYLAHMGLSPEALIAAMVDIAATETARAAAWVERYDADEEDAILADRRDFANEFAAEALRQRETGT